MSAETATARFVDGRYRLGEVLGTGGAAVVRRAHDERLRRDVAVKLFHPGTADEQRQSGELALMASLSHPALVRMYDGGQVNDVNGAQSTYLVMEYVKGPTLRRALDAGAMSRADVAAIGAALSSALAYLHGRGVVHRDVKPANVLLPPDDDVGAKLGDFGIARMLDDARVTATGMTVGTANYLSPEQALGQAVGPAGDIYSLGLVLLESLTGQIAFGGVGVAAALARLNGPPAIPATLGPAWASLLAAMLELDPDARPDAVQVRGDLGCVEISAAPIVDADAVTSTLSAPPAHGTAVLPTLARHRADVGPSEPRLRGDPPRRRMRPVTTFLLIGATAAAIIFGVLAASVFGGASDSPAAPVNPSISTTPTTTTPSRVASTSAAVTRTAPTTAPVTSVKQAANPGGSHTPKPPKVTVVDGHGKAKGKAKHGHK